MPVIKFDFARIGNYEDFYKMLGKKIDLPVHFEHNLDALFDTITGTLKMPLKFEFVHMTLTQLEIFQNLIQTLEDACMEENEFEFSYYLDHYPTH
ncbi:MAG: barstar family protein [Bacteroidetes bacterium]|nr:barstar family protein [Bacteroidota bacterium]